MGARAFALLGVLGALLVASPSARAHGVASHGPCLVDDRPTVYALAFPRGAPGQVVAMTNFGLLRSVDGGASFGWGCVDGYARSPGEDFLDGAPKTLSVLDDGTLYVLHTIGYRESRDGGCGYRFTPDVSLLNASVVQVSSSPLDPALAFAVASSPGDPPFGVFRSDDGGVDYALSSLALYELGAVLTSLVYGAGGNTVYALSVSPVTGPSLWRSDDGGLNGGLGFVERPLALDVDDAVLLGTDPADPDVVYLEVTDQPTDLCAFRTRVLRSDDGGASFSALHARTDDILTGALVRDDGSLWLAWKQAGLERISPSGEVASRLAMPLSCLAEDDAGLVVCPFGGAPALALRYDDEAGAVSPFLTRAQVAGPLSCEPGTPGADVCAPLWPDASAALGLGPPSPDAGPIDAGGIDGGEAPSTGDDAGPAAPDAGPPPPAPRDAGASDPPPAPGDPLDLASERRVRRPRGCQSAPQASLLALVAALGALRRRPRSPRSPRS